MGLVLTLGSLLAHGSLAHAEKRPRSPNRAKPPEAAASADTPASAAPAPQISAQASAQTSTAPVATTSRASTSTSAPAAATATPAATAAPRFSAGLDTAIHAGSPGGDSAFFISPLFHVDFRLSERLSVVGAWGLAHATVNTNDGRATQVRPGNPYAALVYTRRSGEWRYFAGLGGTAPVAILPGDVNARLEVQTAFTYAAAMRGNWNYWLWDHDAFSIVSPFGIERRKANGFIWGLEGGIGVMVPIRSVNERLDVSVQTAADLAYQALPWLRAGGRMSLVVMPRFTGQKTQLAAEPYVRVHNDRWFGNLSVLMNIDRPHGFGFDRGGIWSLRLGGGLNF